MMKEKDDIDRGILRTVEERPGLNIRAAVSPFLLKRSESNLRERVRQLELRGLLRLEKDKHETRLYVVEEDTNAGVGAIE